ISAANHNPPLALFTLTSLRIPSRGESPRTGASCLAYGRGRLQKEVTLQERLLPLLMAAHLHFCGAPLCLHDDGEADKKHGSCEFPPAHRLAVEERSSESRRSVF
ncbi:hypothetical protein XENOCAPTIV_027662, partial [Xenoophorus captivus]